MDVVILVLLQVVAMGFVAFFSNTWCWLDFVIVAVSVINFTASLLGAGRVSLQTDRQTDKQTYIKTDIQTDRYTKILFIRFVLSLIFI